MGFLVDLGINNQASTDMVKWRCGLVSGEAGSIAVSGPVYTSEFSPF